MKISNCPSCGGAVAPDANRCPYCQQYLIRDTVAEQERQQNRRVSVKDAWAGGILFQRREEPNEGAFSLLVPQGWLLEGGIFRANLMQQVVDAQSIEAKLDLTVKGDAAGRVMIRWCPEVKYCDMRMSPAGMMGMFPPGSNYQGMLVYPKMTAEEFLIQFIFPRVHPEAEQVQVVDRKSEPLLVERYRSQMAALGLPAQFSYDGEMVTFTYVEGGVRYRENEQAVIEDMGMMAGGMWSNKDTVIVRAPEEEYGSWEPVLRHIQESVKLNHRWLAQEIVNQEFLSQAFLNAQQASMARDRRMLEVQHHLQEMDRQIVEHRQRTNAEIHNDAYLTLMSLEEYVNPYTNEPEVGSNQWDYRWVTESGDVYYTDKEEDDPNIPSALNRSDWKRTPVRPRFPQ
jgi:hypothetical protein